MQQHLVARCCSSTRGGAEPNQQQQHQQQQQQQQPQQPQQPQQQPQQLLQHAVTYHPDFQINPVPASHRFPMPKDHLLYLALLRDGLTSPQRTFAPTPPDVDTLCLVHERGYVESFLDGSISAEAMRRIGLPWSPQLVQRTVIGTGSAVLAARLALQYGVAAMCNGGTHHAHAGHGAGWCILNDLAVAARAVQRDAGVGQVLMLDLDVHQGDGSASIFAGDPSVYTFSLHCAAQSFPREQPPSDWDIALPAGTGDDEYLRVLGEALPVLFAHVQPGLVLYNAGVDIAAGDQLGLLAVSSDGVAARDAAVLQACLAARVPVAAAIGGGYSPDHESIVARHLHLHRAAAAAAPAFAALMDDKRRRRSRSSSSSRGVVQAS